MRIEELDHPPAGWHPLDVPPLTLSFGADSGRLLDGTKRLCFNTAIAFLVLFLRGSRMIDEALAQFHARRQNINRYRSLLQTKLTEFERQFIERRIAEEEAAISVLAFDASPPDAPFQNAPDAQ